MSKKKIDVPLFESRECSLFKDLTNTIIDCSTNMTHNPTDDPKRKSVHHGMQECWMRIKQNTM